LQINNNQHKFCGDEGKKEMDFVTTGNEKLVKED